MSRLSIRLLLNNIQIGKTNICSYNFWEDTKNGCSSKIVLSYSLLHFSSLTYCLFVHLVKKKETIENPFRIQRNGYYISLVKSLDHAHTSTIIIHHHRYRHRRNHRPNNVTLSSHLFFFLISRRIAIIFFFLLIFTLSHSYAISTTFGPPKDLNLCWNLRKLYSNLNGHFFSFFFWFLFLLSPLWFILPQPYVSHRS